MSARVRVEFTLCALGDEEPAFVLDPSVVVGSALSLVWEVVVCDEVNLVLGEELASERPGCVLQQLVGILAVSHRLVSLAVSHHGAPFARMRLRVVAYCTHKHKHINRHR